MKKLIYMTITIFSFFSIASVSANDGYMDKILDLTYWVEEFKLRMNEINYIYFHDFNSQATYDNFRVADDMLKEEFISLYRNWNIDYYTMNGIINDYNLFVYHTNKMFLYTKMAETSNNNQLKNIILEHYTLTRSYFNRVRYLATKVLK